MSFLRKNDFKSSPVGCHSCERMILKVHQLGVIPAKAGIQHY
ncbi:MAG: hypothetical protein ACYDB5_03930 [bacterium]